MPEATAYRFDRTALHTLNLPTVETWVQPRPDDPVYPYAVVAYIPRHLRHLVPGATDPEPRVDRRRRWHRHPRTGTWHVNRFRMDETTFLVCGRDIEGDPVARPRPPEGDRVCRTCQGSGLAPAVLSLVK